MLQRTENETWKSRIKNPKAARLVVRNLPFTSNEKLITEYFSAFGEITEVKLLRKDNKLTGCGFVQYLTKINAAKAIAKLSGREFMGRPIIVDWALPKDKFLYKIKELQISKNEIRNIDTRETDSDNDNFKKNKHSKWNVEENEQIKPKNIKQKRKHKTVIESRNGKNVNGSDKNEKINPKNIKRKMKDKIGVLSRNNEKDVCESAQDNVGKNEEHKELKENQQLSEKDLNRSKRKCMKSGFKYDPNDIMDGRTLFIKNIPFSVDNEALHNCAEEVGSVIYAVICIDPLTEHSRGTGFIKYKMKEDAEYVLTGIKKLIIEGKILEPYLALKKDQIKNKNDIKSLPTDNRNLYLLREGTVLAGSPAAEGVSKGDMLKRLQLEQRKTQALRNLGKFVSPIRLAVHNIPLNVTDEQLRRIFKQYSLKTAVITEARIMRNLKNIDENGIGKSLGYGFVAFKKHEDALIALRKINNNPSIFSEIKRPIISFAIENRAALRIKEMRKIKNKNAEHNKKKTRESFVSENKTVEVENFCGYTAKPGAKKLRTVRDLRRQAEMHHEEIKKQKKEKRFRTMRKGKKSKFQEASLKSA